MFACAMKSLIKMFKDIGQSLGKHVPSWCPFLDPHLITKHSNICVQIIAMLEYQAHLPYLNSICKSLKVYNF
jgi:hypothetical protein